MKKILSRIGLSLSTRASRKPACFDGFVGQVDDVRRGVPLFRGVVAFVETPCPEALASAARNAVRCVAEISRKEDAYGATVGATVGATAARPDAGLPRLRRTAGAPGAGVAVGRPWGQGPLVPLVVCGEPLSEDLKDLLSGDLGVGYVDRSGAAHVLHVDGRCTLSYFRDYAPSADGRRGTDDNIAPFAAREKLPRKQERVLRVLLSASSQSASRVLRNPVGRNRSKAGKVLLLSDVARLARVSAETVHKTLKNLEDEELLAWKRRGSIRIKQHRRLLDMLEASYTANQRPTLLVEAVDSIEVIQRLRKMNEGSGEEPPRVALTGMCVDQSAWKILEGTLENQAVSFEHNHPIRILVDRPERSLPDVARLVGLEPASAEVIRASSDVHLRTAFLHTVHDESVLYDCAADNFGVRIVSPLQLYLDLKAYSRDSPNSLAAAEYLLPQLFPAYYGW